MISLHRSMHSSQMYTPGPAMSFLTCFWDFPQNEHFSRSAPSPIRVTVDLLPVRPRMGRIDTSRCARPVGAHYGEVFVTSIPHHRNADVSMALRWYPNHPRAKS